MTHRTALITALLALGVSTPAHAIYLQPDLVQIPAERLIANLTRELDAAAPGSADRVRLEIALGRLHAAAGARRAEEITVRSPQGILIDKPEVLSGPGDANAIRGAIAYLDGRGGSVYSRLTRPAPEDAAAGCDPAKVAARWDYVGDVVIDIELPADKAKSPMGRASKVTLVSQSVGEDAVGACLVARVRALDSFTLAARAVKARQRFIFSQGTDPLQPFYGFGDSHIPERVSDAPVDEAARKHLEAARGHYYRALKADPGNALAHLGLSWTLEQLGLRDEAITCFRKTFAAAWNQEKDIQIMRLGQIPIAGEAAASLLRLLDPDKDAAERATLDEALRKLVSVPRPVTPIVIPLGAADTLDALVDPTAAVSFDLDGSGVTRPWGWIRPGAGWLVFDEGATGSVRSGLQLFGSVSFWSFWRDGYQALAALDDDGDGVVSGAELASLAVWEDRDGDGVSDPGEVQPLAALGITALSTAGAPDAAGVMHSALGVTFADGRVRPTWDWVTETR